MPTRQTTSFLIKRFQDAGIRPDTRLGQNFLVDLNLLEVLVDAAELTSEDVVLEVGTGLGSLTALLAQRAGAVVTVEIDRRLQQLAAEQIVGMDNVRMLCHDVLKNKNELHPVVLSAVREELERSPGRRLKLVANLPYCVATPVLSNLLAADVLPAAMVVTIQMELAERITARPGTKDFGALSVWIQSQCDTRIMRCMPPSVFWPRPKVRSAIVQIVPAAAKRDRIADRKFFHAFIRDLFLHRRKHLRSALWTALKESLSKAEVDAILQQQGQEAEVRAEQLDTAVLLALAESVRQRLTKAR